MSADQPLHDRRISIIGLGWLGLPLARSLQQAGAVCRGSCRSTEKATRLRQSGLDCRLLDCQPEPQGELHYLLADCHTLFITLPPGRKQQQPDWHRQQVSALTTAARQQGVQHVVYTSSTAVYGRGHGPVDETSPTQPDSPSGLACLAAEQQIQQHWPTALILRLAGLVGPQRHPGRFLAGKTLLQGGSEAVNLIHRDDVISAGISLLEQGASGVFNLCASQHPDRASFYAHACRLLDLSAPVFLPHTDEQEHGKRITSARLSAWLKDWPQHPDPMAWGPQHFRTAKES